MRVYGLILALLCGCPGDDGKDSGERPYVDQDGDGFAANIDCDDSSSAIYPDADEVCDGLDNDCDGDADETGAGGVPAVYEDADRDGYGDPEQALEGCAEGVGFAEGAGDCDDGDGNIHPDAEELCDGVDNDCDGDIADGTDGETFYEDGDGDGYGDPASAFTSCTTPTDAVDNGDDCDDNNNKVYPGATERDGDEVDNDCDGDVDEGGGSDELSFEAVWTSDSTGDILDIVVTGGSGTYTLGWVESEPGVSDPWTGEDCLNGYTASDGTLYLYCHPIERDGGTFESIYEEVVSGSRTLRSLDEDTETLFTAGFDRYLTYAAWSDGTGECWTWGYAPSYYTGEGCTEL